MIDILIVQGTTPSYEFELEDENNELVGADQIKTVSVVFSQRKSGIEIKKKYTKGASNNTCAFEKGIITVQLTQEETLGFMEDQEVGVELKVLFNSGEVMVSDRYRARVVGVLDKEVLK